DRPALSLEAEQAAALAIPASFLQRFALVVQLLAAAERYLDLRAALVVEIDLQRNDGHALALHGARKLVDLALVQQELARALGRVIEAVRLQIFRDVGVDQPDLAVAAVGIGLGNRALALAQRLHLGAGQDEAGLEH